MAKILLVEDNEMNRDLISRKLRRQGYEVVLAVDGAEGIEKANDEKPALVLMDMGLPILDGYAATRLLKGNEETRQIPIIGLSAHAMTGDADKAKDAGCDDYDTKPVEWDRLLQKIETILDRSRSLAAAGVDMVTTTLDPKASGALRSSHVLVVDDSPMHREVLSRRLTELGHTCDVAEDVGQAADLLLQRPFDAVLLDVTLPDGSSPRFLKQVKSDPVQGAVPVLMLSPIDAVDRAMACLDDGAADFVPQPFHVRVLRTRLATALELRRLREKEKTYEEVVGGEERHSEHLLRVLFPDPIVEELKTTQKILPKRWEDVAVVFCDVVGFKDHCDDGEPVETLTRLQELIGIYEEVLGQHKVLKIKTVGDSLMAAVGLFQPVANPVLHCVRCALAMKDAAEGKTPGWKLRFGIHAGPVVAGVVGRQRYQFDLWGSTVQTAALVKRHGAIDAVNVSGEAWKRVDEACAGESLGNFPIAEGEALTVYRVDRVLAV